MSLSSGAEVMVPEEEQLDLLKVFFEFLEYSKNVRNKISTLGPNHNSRRKSAEVLPEHHQQRQK